MYAVSQKNGKGVVIEKESNELKRFLRNSALSILTAIREFSITLSQLPMSLLQEINISILLRRTDCQICKYTKNDS